MSQQQNPQPEALHEHVERSASLLSAAARLDRPDALQSLPVEFAKPRDIADRAAMAGRLFLLRPAEPFEVEAFAPQIDTMLGALRGRLGSALNVPEDAKDALRAGGRKFNADFTAAAPRVSGEHAEWITLCTRLDRDGLKLTKALLWWPGETPLPTTDEELAALWPARPIATWVSRSSSVRVSPLIEGERS